MGEVRVIFVKYFLRHAIAASEVAAVSDAYSQVPQGSPEGIQGRRCSRRPGCVHGL
jgi:hypothetical protein